MGGTVLRREGHTQLVMAGAGHPRTSTHALLEWTAPRMHRAHGHVPEPPQRTARTRPSSAPSLPKVCRQSIRDAFFKKKGQKNVPLERDKFTQKGGRGRRVNVTEFGPFILSESAALQQSEGASASWLTLVSSDANIHKTSYRFFF